LAATASKKAAIQKTRQSTAKAPNPAFPRVVCDIVTFADRDLPEDAVEEVFSTPLAISGQLGMPYELMVKDTLLWVMDGAFDYMLRIFDH